MQSSFTPTSDAWDLVIGTSLDDEDPLTLMLVQDDESGLWEGGDAPALSTDQQVPREVGVMWRPRLGAGYSRRTEATTTTGPDGQIVSAGTAYGNNATFVLPDVVMPAGALTEIDLPAALDALTTGNIHDAEEYGPAVSSTDRDVYFTTSTRYLVKVDTSDVATVRDIGASYTTDALQIFDGKLYLSGAGNGLVQEFDAATSTWTSAAANCKASRMAVVNWMPSNAIMDGSGGGVPSDHLILVEEAAHGFRHVVSGNDVKVFANWIGVGSNPIPIGDLTATINSVVPSPRVVWFARPDGLFGLTETGRVVNLAPWMARALHSLNGMATAFYSDEQRAFVLFGHQQGLVAIEVNGTQQQGARFIPFAGSTSNETPIWGRPRWIAPYVDGVFVAYFDGTNSYVMRLIFERDGSYRWSGPECTIEDEEVTFMRVTSRDGAPRLWIATMVNATVSNGVGTVKLYWQSLPESGSPWIDYISGTGHRFATEWDVYLPRDDVNSSSPKKDRRFDLVARGPGDGNEIAVDVSVDDNDYVEQGTMAEGLRASFYAAESQQGAWFNWRLRCTNSATVPIALESFQARVAVLPEQVDTWTFRCTLAAGQGIGNDAEDIRDPATIRARLRALQRAGQTVYLLRSPLSREPQLVKVEQGARIQSIWSRKDRAYIAVVTFSVSILNSDAVYGSGIYGVDTYGIEESA